MKRGVLLIILVLIVITGVGWYVIDKNNQKDSTVVNSYTSASTQDNNDYLVIKEWGVRFKLPTNLIAKLKYFQRNSAGRNSYAIDDPSVELENCAPVSLDRTAQPNLGYKKIGEYYYAAVLGAQACDTAESIRQQAANRVQEEIKGAINNSLELAN
jgi:hypothetical protein